MRTPNEIESILIDFFDRDYTNINDIIIAPIQLAIKLSNVGIKQTQHKFGGENIKIEV